MIDWIERERQRIELIASLDEADADYERGDYLTIATEDDRRAFVEGVLKRCRTRLEIERGEDV